MKRIVVVSLAVVFVLFSAGWILVILAIAPPLVSSVALVLMVIVAAWLVVRQRSHAGINPEHGFFAPSSSKEGLL